MQPRPWREAMAAALYGDAGFYRRDRPAGHFRTAPRSAAFVAAIRRLADRVDAGLGRPARFDVVDVGAGGGELLAGLAADAPPRWRLSGVDVAPRPADLPAEVRWHAEPPRRVEGLVLANEWLDVVPVDVVELTAGGPRVVLVDDAGDESLGGPPGPADERWLAHWWPLRRVGDRAEVGRDRDRGWADLVARVSRGVALAIDYGHTADRRPAGGTLVGYRHGRQLRPVPDGSMDLTAHVAVDACAATAGTPVLTTQRAGLRRLGVGAAAPPPTGARTDPVGYLRALSAAGEATELLDAGGLGSFRWLVHPVGTGSPLG